MLLETETEMRVLLNVVQTIVKKKNEMKRIRGDLTGTGGWRAIRRERRVIKNTKGI